MTRLPKILLAAVVTVAGAALASNGLARSVAAHLWPAERFSRCTVDPRIFCEPGSEPFARAIAGLLPTAVAQVEHKQYGAFVKPVKIYTYNSQDTYALYAGTRGGAGSMSFGEVHLAPAMQTVPTQYAALLAHELSHLHLAQRIGVIKMMRLPHWFKEGWATHTSGGGGAGNVTAEQAIFALVHGRHFTPGEADTLAEALSPARASSFKLESGMYYRQASLLVDYLQRRDPQAFAGLIRDVEAGQRLGPTLIASYGQPLSILWQDFQADLRDHPAARWAQGAALSPPVTAPPATLKTSS